LFLTGLRREIPRFQEGVTNFIINIPQNETLKTVLALEDEEAEDLAYEIDREIEEVSEFIGDRGELFRQLFNSENITTTLQIGQRTLASLANILIDIILFFLSWSIFMINGRKWLNNFLDLLPFTHDEQEILTEDFREGVRNVVYASLTSALIHTTAISAILWGFDIQGKFIILSFVIIVSILPLSPAEIAYAVPISLVFVQNPAAALILVPIAEILILWSNYIVIPRIIASSDNGNPLLIITSILSGILIFGVMGFIIGPVLMVFIASLYKILVKRIREVKEVMG
jgi:predicted PurR-regulated permease PerM